MEFLHLPVVMIENIFSYLSYDEIAKNRLVCRAFNEMCSRMLNRGFHVIERRHALALKTVKAQLPRRESERRYHPLSRHCDILTSIETRISMLNMTYSKYIDNGFCCFIPGKVIDEIQRVLQIVETTKTTPRAHEVLQELRDISSMAIEHFDDKISPAFRKILHDGIRVSPPRAPNNVTEAFVRESDSHLAAMVAPLQLRQDINTLRRQSILNAKLSLFLASNYKKFHKRILDYKKLAWKQRKIIRNMLKRQREHDATIADLKKRIEECDIRYSELTHTNQAVGAASSAAEVASTSSAPLRHFGSQIKLDLSVLPIGTNKRNNNKILPNMKPREPRIKLPSISDDSEPQLKPQEPKLQEPSTSTQPPKPKTQTEIAIARLTSLTKELRQLSNFARGMDKPLKRPILADDDLKDCEHCKTPKLDTIC